MDMEMLLSLPWGLMLPEFIIVGAAVLLSLLDLFDIGKRKLGLLAILAVLSSLVALIFLYNDPASDILYGTFVLDGFSKAFKSILLVGAALVLMLALSDYEKKMIEDRSEYFYLFLTALLGAMIMTSSNDLITLFVGLELLSLSSYILVGIRKTCTASNEAAMKYVINGGIATAITLFGMSYLYGLTGTTNATEMMAVLQGQTRGDVELLLSIAFLLTFVGLAFKLAAAPFHMWAPDVYEGAPTPVTAFLGTVSKLAGFVIMLRIFLLIFSGTPAGTTTVMDKMQIYIAVLAVASMVIGNVVALKQTNVKRMLAYSGIAHAGYLLVPFATLSVFTLDSMWFYMLAYLLMSIGAFAVLYAISRSGDDSVHAFSGLYRRSPLLAIAMTIFILSLAGIPGTAGFIGKVHIFLSALAGDASYYVLPAILMATTVISFAYYFRILQLMFFRASEEEVSAIPLNLKIVITVCAVFTIVCGILPAIGYDIFYENFPFMRDFFYIGQN